MIVLEWLTLIWVGLVVLALVVYLGATALYLHGARGHLAGIADDLEKVAVQTVPLGEKLGQVGADVGAIAGALVRVDTGLGNVIAAVESAAAKKAS